MNNQKLFVKVLAFLSLLSGIIWLGSYLTRMIISYSHFDIRLSLLVTADNEVLKSILMTVNPAVIATFISYIIFIITFTLFIIFSKINLKKNGWLFIIVLIVYVTFPFEAYLMTFDYKLIYELNFNKLFNPGYCMGLIRERFIRLNGFPVVIVLSYCSIVYFLLFKPFSNNTKDEN